MINTYPRKGASTFSPRRYQAVATSVLVLLIGALAAVLADPGVSGASVIAESGAVLFESPPPLVSAATGESNTAINFFTERTDLALPTTTPIDITPGSSFPTNYDGTANLTPSTLAAGTAVDSYFMYSNPVGEPNKIYNYTASLTFSAPILGVIVTPNTLTETNASLGAPGTTYETSGASDGLENTDDRVELVRPSTIYLDFETTNDIDSIRIITAATPGTSASGTSGDGSAGYAAGYTEVASDGGIFNFGTQFFGSMGGQALNRPMVGGAQVSGQPGYWTVASDGGVFSFGGAGFYGSTGGQPLNAPVVGMASTPDGLGYWLVASDGGVFNYGDAAFYGSTGGMHLNKPIVGMASTSDGRGYWLVASDGGIFAFGDATLLRLDWILEAQQTHRRNDDHPPCRWILAHCFRRWHFFLRRCTILRFNGRSKAQQTDDSHQEHRRRRWLLDRGV